MGTAEIAREGDAETGAATASDGSPALAKRARTRWATRRGHSGGKNTSADITMITGNIPIGKSTRVKMWKTITATYAKGRTRAIESSHGMLVSNRKPAQLINMGTPSMLNKGPSQGRSV